MRFIHEEKYMVFNDIAKGKKKKKFIVGLGYYCYELIEDSIKLGNMRI